MRILIIDVTRDFGLFTPFEKPLGGLQSGLCYLARELSLQGHQITIVNGCAEEHVEEGVRFLPWHIEWPGASEMDAIIVTAANSEMMEHWQRAYGRKPLWLFWVHYDNDQQAIAILKTPKDRDRFDGFLYVSEWQAQVFRETFGIGWDRAFVMRNAVSPTFHKLFQPGEAILPAKSADPLLVYTSTPYRGLGPLMDAVPLIRAKVPNARFQIFSSWAVYGRSGEQDPHQELYTRCRTTPGVEYVGGVPQTELAQHLKRAWCVAYPSIFRETSCIAVMEGLAAGCKVITTHLAALPETTSGFGELVINPADDDDLARRFADRAVRVIGDFQTRPAEIERELQASVAHAHASLSWAQRAAQLGEWLSARRALYARAIEAAGNSLGATRVMKLSESTQMVQARHGAFIVTSAEDDCMVSRTLASMGEWLEGAVGLMSAALRPGDAVVDVGAHIGGMTVPFAKAVGPSGKVFAFEAQEDFYRQLEANVIANGLSQVTMANLLAGDGGTWASEPCRVPVPGAARPWARFRPADKGEAAVRLDDLLSGLEACRLVKISAPGMADRVLSGLSDLIARTRPLILCEISSDAEFLALRKALREQGYLLHWQCTEMYPVNNAFMTPQSELPPLSVLHLLAVPQGMGIFSPLQPALFLRDPDVLFANRAMIFRETGEVEAPVVEPSGDVASFDGRAEALVAKWQGKALLSAHRSYVLTQSYGEGDAVGHALWAELLSGDLSGKKALILGNGGAAVASLWGLLGKERGQGLKIDLSCATGFIPQPDMEKIGLLVWSFALDREIFRLVDGKALPGSGERYDLIYCRSGQDAAMAARLLAPGGVLVQEEAAASADAIKIDKYTLSVSP